MFLLYSFMDEIPGITARLIGGNDLPKSNLNLNALSHFTQLRGFLEKNQERGANLAKNALLDSGKTIARLGSGGGGKKDDKTESNRDGPEVTKSSEGKGPEVTKSNTKGGPDAGKS
jgi:hypothetical protein